VGGAVAAGRGKQDSYAAIGPAGAAFREPGLAPQGCPCLGFPGCKPLLPFIFGAKHHGALVERCQGAPMQHVGKEQQAGWEA